MKDNLQGISFDRQLMRAKDLALLVGIIFSWIGASITAGIYVVRTLDKISNLEQQINQIRDDLTDVRKRSKG